MGWVPLDLADRSEDAWMNRDPAEVVDALAELLALLEPPAWHARASCRGEGPGRWFPGRGQALEPALALCRGCPVAADCLDAGLEEHHGIWGGSSERGRRQLRRDAA